MITYSQVQDGVVALNIPARNSLMFNRFVAQPTFSFVREQNKYITVTNKRELLGIQDAPQTYFFNYSGRIQENIGAGIGVYQQNYGVLTTFGGIVNFAYNIRVHEDSNFTFGLNIGAYKSGLNSGKVVTNFDDPALNNIPSNFLLTANPGFNYGTGFMDFGISVNNLVTYNFNASGLVEDNPNQGIQGHVMYTGYFDGYGFFGESRFSALARSEFQKDATLVSGVLMLTVPKGIWAQVGYNTMYGGSGGLGINLTKQIAVEYNYEKAFVGLTNLGASHEITLAYKFKNTNYYEYSRDDDMAGLFTSEKKRSKKKVIAKAPEKSNTEEQARLEAEKIAEAQVKLEADKQAKLIAQEQARLIAEEQAKLKAERIAESQAKLKAERIAEEHAKLIAEKQAKLIAEEQAKLKAEKIAKERLIKNPTDNIGKSINQLVLQTEASSIAQGQLLKELENAVALKEQDLEELKDENTTVEPKPFESISVENERIELLKINLDTVIIRNKKKIILLESLLQDRVNAFNDPNDETNLYFQNLIATLKSEQEKSIRDRESLVSSLEQITIATDLFTSEKRRIEEEEIAKAAEKSNDKDRLIKNPTDNIGKSMSQLVSQNEESRIAQAQLLKELETAVAIKDKDLKELKEENDLSEQNIYVEPKPFKSISEENERIELLKINLDTVIIRNKKKIILLESLLQDRVNAFNDPNDETNIYYRNLIATLKSEQEESIRSRESLVSSLEQISIATGFERKRRIKRAAYDNDLDRYTQDRKMLNSLRENVSLRETPLVVEDLDFGRERNNNIQILKNVHYAESGYYLVLAVHSDVNKRDEFLVQVISSGYKEVDFFYDVNTSEYYIYSKKFNAINDAERALTTKLDKPYNQSITLFKIEN
jgi:type IX secretion system PorP/SprF family membrane protein